MVDHTARIDPSARIQGPISMGPYSRIGPGVSINCPSGFSMGACGEVAEGARIACWSFEAGDYLHLQRQVEVGGGQALLGNDRGFRCGRGVFIGQDSIVNTAAMVTIGDESALGARCGVWTHGAWGPADRGFPDKVAPVEIGAYVWVTGCTNVLPGVRIGDNVVISMASVVRRNLPPGCTVAGNPAVVLRRDALPQQVDTAKLSAQLAAGYLDRLKFLGADAAMDARENGIAFTTKHWEGCFDFGSRKVSTDGKLDELAEDFRDYLRRHGIRFFTGLPFRSMPCPSTV